MMRKSNTQVSKSTNTYNHLEIEKRWQKEWDKKKIYKTREKGGKKYYVLDMFPYPSGTGLHVGHPKGYIGSDVFARMKKMQGFNILHPMGYDAFGLPAEQYALEHHIHPRKAVIENVKMYEGQLNKIGFSYDWDRRVNTTDPEFYRWTQWIFLKIFNSWYNIDTDKAEPIENLIKKFEKSGNIGLNAVSSAVSEFTAGDWELKTPKERQDILMNYRLAYEGFSEVNWSPVLGTVLANDEVVDGPDGLVSERGGYPVVKKDMRQWFLRITAYADRLLLGLDNLDWSWHIKEIQKNWIGKSIGAEIDFKIKYINQTKNRTQEDRTDETKEKTGVELWGVKAINPANGEEIPIWIADYVLAQYGTGAIMAVPAHDERDLEFAKKYILPVKKVVVPYLIDSHDPPIIGKKTVNKKIVQCVIENPNRDKILVLKWEKFSWVSLISGGIDDNENPQDTVIREIK